MTRLPTTFALLALAALAGCGKTPPPELATYANATLTPGAGLGDLQLGKTTLAQVLAKLGPGQVALLASDESGYELNYADGELALLFMVQGGPCWVAQRDYSMRKAADDLRAFIAAVPACAGLPLSSISVRGDFYRGATNRGIRIGDDLATAHVHGEPQINPPADMHAGMHDAPALRAQYPDGLSLFVTEVLPDKPAPVLMMLVVAPRTEY